MQCNLCREEFQWLGDNPPEEPMCPECIGTNYDHDVARHRAKRINYYKELIQIDQTKIAGVTIGNVEVECTGYYLSGQLWDQEIIINGCEVYGILDIDVQGFIEEELIRRVMSGDIINRIKKIEKEFPDNKDPATLRLERSDLDGQLEKIEGVAR